MPFGEKKDVDGNDIDFDDIYRFFFKKAVEDVDIECIRCDEIEEAGSIHEKMFEHIYQADVVVVDITTANANVYYELGVRHALAPGVTILIRRKGTTIPFNIQGLQVVEYDQARFGSVERAKARVHQIIRNGLNRRIQDSPVHAVLDLNIEPEGKPIGETKFHEFQLKGTKDTAIGLITGDIQNVRKDVDVWVNSENTNMQMARPFENSISGVIRYHGSEKAEGQVTDTIALALAHKMQGRTSVNAAEVLVTTAGALERTHKVKRIFHVAAVVGQVGTGYTPIADVPSCVVNALNAVKDYAEDCKGCSLSSILFPLIGMRQRRGMVLEDRVKPLLDAAIAYLLQTPDCTFRKVYFLTYTDKELEACRGLLRADPRLTALDLNPPAVGEAIGETPVTQRPASGPTGALAPERAVPDEQAPTVTRELKSSASAGAERSNSEKTAPKRPKSRQSGSRKRRERLAPLLHDSSPRPARVANRSR